MGTPSDTRTSLTLLELLRSNPADPGAWERFVERYGPMIHAWCRKWGVQQADADDVSQVVLAKLLIRMRTFVHDREHRFRAWLHTVVHHAWADLAAEQRRGGSPGRARPIDELVSTAEARDDLLAQIERDHQAERLRRAMDVVRSRVEPQTWCAFERTALQEQPMAQAAASLGMSIGAVYQARTRVRGMIRREIEDLEERGELEGRSAWNQAVAPPPSGSGGS